MQELLRRLAIHILAACIWLLGSQTALGADDHHTPRALSSDAPINATSGTQDSAQDQVTVPGPRTPFFGELEDRFSILAAGHLLLRNAVNIDKIVGDPWTLEPDTISRLERVLPEQIKLQFTRMLAESSANFYFVPQEQMNTAPREPHPSISLQNPESLYDQLKNSRKFLLSGTFRDENYIDLGVFILSKAPFFPGKNDHEGWNSWKNKIVAFDVYILGAVVVAELLLNKGHLGVAGWIFKGPNDRYRIGWYGSISNAGFSSDPNASLGAKVRFPYAEISAGARGNLAQGEKLSIETRLSKDVISRFANPKEWEFRVSAAARYVLIHSDIAKDFLVVDGHVFAKKYDFLGVKGVHLSFGSNASVNTAEADTNSFSMLLEDQYTGSILTLAATHDKEWKIGGFWGGSFESRFEYTKNHVKTSARRVLDDLQDLKLATSGNNTRTIGLARMHLKRHLRDYANARVEYLRLRTDNDSELKLIAESTLAFAEQESLGETYGAKDLCH